MENKQTKNAKKKTFFQNKYKKTRNKNKRNKIIINKNNATH